ncbi:MAG: 4-hydroxythreonine-4-phosphate dehydrogenase PdxA [Bacteroides sp.]|nr:4-hydroxythreonine-4-phosphate dehydrogenase PdxA [Bacteroides sp.]MCM1379296.1 4-hydroxythreonine-4-phosphate dehydrogenase PdxA [Bacteroides sp.]MCM1445045.1 4-hydroxythreonine-4-phosphate dehydrogenase PdxA [Prevotella sp.]
MEDRKIKVGITHGDYNGIGYEIILKAFEDPQMFDLCTPVVYGSQRLASAYRKQLEIPTVPVWRAESGSQAKDGHLNFVNVVGDDEQLTPGHSTEAAGKAALAALERATSDLKTGEIDVIVTAPINKENIQGPEFHFPGHTEYFEAALGDAGNHALMIMASEDGLRVALATVHLPLAKVAGEINTELIVRRLEEFNSSLIRDFGVHSPRIAVLALNPHAGDGGLLGKEEEEIIIPAVAEANNLKIQAFGPYPADGFFGAGHHVHFDGILAMYHDQGLIPFKTLCGTSGVNFTAGLPFVRTSPDHGTAYDIAGKGVADAQSMRQAIYMAIDALRNREIHDEAFANPLKKLYQDRPAREF